MPAPVRVRHDPACPRRRGSVGARSGRVGLPARFFTANAPAPHDSAVVTIGAERVALTTDSFVVSPRFFPGGDIGKLAVCGTINDLAMAGATTAFLTAAFVLEEGLPHAELERVVRSMRDTAAACGVALVAGDTKVVDRARATASSSPPPASAGFRPASICVRNACSPGDVVLVSGDVGRHGMAVLTTREGLSFDPPLTSDCAPLAELVAALLASGADVRCLRDPTRGGLVAALNEIASACGRRSSSTKPRSRSIAPSRAPARCWGSIPSTSPARGGSSPSSRRPTPIARAALRAHPLGAGAAWIGVVEPGPAGEVVALTAFGGERLLDLPLGEPLPRICRPPARRSSCVVSTAW